MILKWMDQSPEKPGFYWVKAGKGRHIVEVVESRQLSGLSVKLAGWVMIPLPLFVVDAWAGPLAEPEEA